MKPSPTTDIPPLNGTVSFGDTNQIRQDDTPATESKEPLSKDIKSTSNDTTLIHYILDPIDTAPEGDTFPLEAEQLQTNTSTPNKALLWVGQTFASFKDWNTYNGYLHTKANLKLSKQWSTPLLASHLKAINTTSYIKKLIENYKFHSVKFICECGGETKSTARIKLTTTKKVGCTMFVQLNYKKKKFVVTKLDDLFLFYCLVINERLYFI
eukprot:GAHX01004260.1.p1 GENE.GAHX01004260.1~~GAHX01004260.1.p1  ORF type:complete len:211 (+),score=33.32 GAHX01004260.1:40-672(+)